MKFNKTLAIVAASLALAAPFAANAQADGKLEWTFNQKAYMAMADKNGMISKADMMKMVEAKIDKMAKNGMLSMQDFSKLLNDLYAGRN